jgi:5'-nucleotidase
MKNLLISNDDGIHSRGIWAVKDFFESKYRVFVVAPDRERSASGHSMSLHDPIRLTVLEKGRVFSVSGTPVDAVHLALLGLVEEKIDLVITGINNGLNLGTDVFYSGTVSGAFQAASFDIPGIAVSIDTHHERDPNGSPVHYETATHFVDRIVEKLRACPIDRKILLNVNVPNLPLGEIRGVEITRLGTRHYYDNLIEREDPKKNKYYWIEGIHARDILDDGTDVKAVHEKKVSITPLRLDITAADYVERLKGCNFHDL